MMEYRRLSNRIEFKLRQALIPSNNPNSLWRKYYTTRNLIYLMSFVYRKPLLATKFIGISFIKSLAGFYHGPSFGIRNFKTMIRAIFDGLSKRMGRTLSN
jgi:hypothetical protein